MMKILLMNPPILCVGDLVESAPTFPNIGLASIAAYLEKKGHDVRVMDNKIDSSDADEILSRVGKFSPRIIGISAYTEDIVFAGEVAKRIKERYPKMIIAVGGSHASAIPERTLEEFAFDVAVIGEGEITISEIADAVEKGKGFGRIKGICFRDKGKIRKTAEREIIADLDSLPSPAWHLFPLEKYRGRTPSGMKRGQDLILPVEGARGCPFDCFFCCRLHGKRIRFKSPKRIVDEIRDDVERFGATSIHFVEGTFAANRKKGIAICDDLISRGLNRKIRWEAGGRVDCVDMELLKKMKAAGCSVLGYGVESGNEEILKKAGKNTNLWQIRNAIGMTKAAGITAGACFIIGLPYENEKTINETIDFAGNLGAHNPNFVIPVPFPGTRVAEMAKNGEAGLKILSENWSEYGKQNGKTLELETVNRKRLKQLQRKAYLRYYMRPSKIPYLISMGFSIIMPRILMKIKGPGHRAKR